ncbi:MAG: hypothetical protein D0530_11200 [Methylococcales bacterium]|nr:MAG: hypothetical protein D0530_11200 [Methylococcales bacterium]
MDPIEIEVVEEFVTCPNCGTNNRIRSHAATVRPICGKCRAPLTGRSSTSSRSFYSYVRAHREALCAYAAALVLIGLYVAIGMHHPAPPVLATQSIPLPTRKPETKPESIPTSTPPQRSIPSAGQYDDIAYIRKHQAEITAQTPTPPKPPALSEPELPLPYQGVYDLFEGYDAPRARCPLHLKTRTDGSYYFVKLEGWYSRQPVARYFVHAGETFNTHVPPGSYRLKYANGQHWYGAQHLFGPNTVYSMADARLDFTEDTDGYTGLTIELILQINGNLSTKQLRKEEF